MRITFEVEFRHKETFTLFEEKAAADFPYCELSIISSYSGGRKVNYKFESEYPQDFFMLGMLLVSFYAYEGNVPSVV